MIGVTGATGHLGRLVVRKLIERGVSPDDIAALARTPDKAEDLADQGVEVRRADYTEPETLPSALRGVDRLLLISATEVGERTAQHGNVIRAAKEAGVQLLAYTSILHADEGQTMLADEHGATEEMIRESGIPYVFLRNGWYLENYTENLGPVLEYGVLLGSARDGRVSAATRGDLADAAAAVLAGDGHENRIYELGGDESFTLAELADTIARESGKPVVYQDMAEDAHAAALTNAGLPEPIARMLADSDQGVRRGELYTDSGDLSRLIGRPTTSAREAVAAGLRG